VLLLALSVSCSKKSDGLRSVEVQAVLDGDTFDAVGGERIRLLGIDTPEKADECYGQEAFTILRDRLVDRTVQLELDVQIEDGFGRTLAYVYIDGELVNGEMLVQGAACVLIIPPNGRYANYFATLEDSARAAGTGLWTPCGGCDTPN